MICSQPVDASLNREEVPNWAFTGLSINRLHSSEEGRTGGAGSLKSDKILVVLGGLAVGTTTALADDVWLSDCNKDSLSLKTKNWSICGTVSQLGRDTHVLFPAFFIHLQRYCKIRPSRGNPGPGSGVDRSCQRGNRAIGRPRCEEGL